MEHFCFQAPEEFRRDPIFLAFLCFLLMADKWVPLEDTICLTTLLTHPTYLRVCFVVASCQKKRTH